LIGAKVFSPLSDTLFRHEGQLEGLGLARRPAVRQDFIDLLKEIDSNKFRTTIQTGNILFQYWRDLFGYDYTYRLESADWPAEQHPFNYSTLPALQDFQEQNMRA
jgi:hypothetical protein